VEIFAIQRGGVSASACNIIPFDGKYKADFARLNYAWIEKYFAVEPLDRSILDHPEAEIIARGGQIFFAVRDGKAVGTVALKVESETRWELTKMGVDEQRRGLGYGRLLLDAAVAYARAAQVKQLVLSSHTSLAPAIALYRKAGFVDRPDIADSCYSRCNIYMQLDL